MGLSQAGDILVDERRPPMICILCHQNIDLFELDDWVGEPVHTWCRAGAERAWTDALNYAKAEREKRAARSRAA